MGTLKSNVIEPATGTNLTLGASGDLIDVASDTLQLNTWKDSGGNTLFTSDGSGTLSSVNSGLSRGGGPNLILSQTASGSSSISFTSDIDSTYDKYMFVFTNIGPATDGTHFSFQMGSSYNTTMTTTVFRAYHNENDSTSGLGYDTAFDQAQGTAYQNLSYYQSNDADSNCSGELYLFAPSSTTYVKHFNCTTNSMEEAGGALRTRNMFTAGYFNTTSALTAINFKMSSGNFDGKIKMYGCR